MTEIIVRNFALLMTCSSHFFFKTWNNLPWRKIFVSVPPKFIISTSTGGKNAFPQQRAKIGQRVLHVEYLTLLCNKIKNWCALLMPSLHLELLIGGGSACAKSVQLSPIPIENGTYRCQKIWLWRQRTKARPYRLWERGRKLRGVGKGVPMASQLGW